jgi:hypothetical protein
MVLIKRIARKFGMKVIVLENTSNFSDKMTSTRLPMRAESNYVIFLVVYAERMVN